MNEPIFSVLNNKPIACCYYPVTGGDSGFNSCDQTSYITYEIYQGSCAEFVNIPGCITSGGDHMGYNINISTDPESQFAYDYPDGLCGTCGYKKVFNGGADPCFHIECSSLCEN
jgi:hypothetical protein